MTEFSCKCFFVVYLFSFAFALPVCICLILIEQLSTSIWQPAHADNLHFCCINKILREEAIGTMLGSGSITDQ